MIGHATIAAMIACGLYRFNDHVDDAEGLARKRAFQRRLAAIASSDGSGS